MCTYAYYNRHVHMCTCTTCTSYIHVAHSVYVCVQLHTGHSMLMYITCVMYHITVYMHTVPRRVVCVCIAHTHVYSTHMDTVKYKLHVL